MDEKIGVEYKDITADAGYESEENYTYFENKKQTCYIKPQNYERSKTKKFKSNMSLRENMHYDKEKDEYTCQNDKKLKVVGEIKSKSKNGFPIKKTVYECESCLDCPFKSSCTKARGNRKIIISKKFIEQRKNSLENITSEKGVILRKNRSIQVEGAFGVLKQDYGFRRFSHRGKKMTLTEFSIIAIAFNINKFHNKIQAKRTGLQLFVNSSA